MAILLNNDLGKRFKVELGSASTSLVILSAFIKTSSLEWIKSFINPNVNVTVIARWQLNDLICGASDLSAYEFASANGWSFGINTNMHHKLYLIDNEKLFIGSANLTNRGFHLGSSGNDESSVLISPTNIDLIKLDNYLNFCCYLDDTLYSNLQYAINEVDHEERHEGPNKWPRIIEKQLNTQTQNIWVNDLLFNSPKSIKNECIDFTAHDLSILDINDVQSISDKERLLTNFRCATVWQWLIRVVNNSTSEFVRFGEVTAKLHEDLIDDPKPYRKEIKVFVANLYEWIRYLDPPELGIKKFNRTEALYFKD